MQHKRSFLAVPRLGAKVCLVISNEEPAVKMLRGFLCQKEGGKKKIFIKHPLPLLQCCSVLSNPEAELPPRIIATSGCGTCERFYFTLWWKSERLQAALARGSAVWLTALLVFHPTFLQLFWFIFSVCQHRLHVSFVSFQDGVWPPWVGGVFPARRWAEETARAGCGEREMRRVTFLRSGRNTGSFWRTTACTGTSTRRRVAFYSCRLNFPAS